MNISENQIIGNLVAEDYRTASVFKQNNIDFCCNGNRTIAEACQTQNITVSKVVEQLVQVTTGKNNSNTNYQSWPIELLADYIEKTHHNYVREKINEITPYLDKICKVHGNHHPELLEINKLFAESADDLIMHMKKEEAIVFPFVRDFVKAKQQGVTMQTPPFGSVKNPVQVMMEEHDNEGDRFRKIAALSNNYTVPEDGCNTYRVTFALLKEFEDDLHLHIHLENNILFPKVVQQEAE